MADNRLGFEDFIKPEAQKQILDFFNIIDQKTKEIDSNISRIGKGSFGGSGNLKDVKSGGRAVSDAEKERKEIERNRKEIERLAEKEYKLAQAERKRYEQSQKNIVTEKQSTQAMQSVIRSEQQLIDVTNLLVKRRKQLDTTTKEGRAEWEKLTKVINQNTDRLKANDAQIGRFQRNVGNYKAAFSGLMTAFGIGGGLALFASTLKDAGRNMIEFEKSVSNLSAITGIVGKQLEYLKGTAIDVGMSVEGGAKAVIESYKLIASQNSDLAGNAAALAEINKQAIILSQASGDDLQTSTTNLMQILNKMGVGASDSGKALDILAASVKFGTSEMPNATAALLNFGGTMKLVAQNSNSANDNVREANSLIQVLAKNGKEGADAGVGLRNVLLKLAAVDVLPKAAIKQLKEAGVNMNMLKDTSIPLSDRLKELSKISNNASALTKVFGTENLEVGKIVLSNIELFDKYNEQFKENGVAAEQAATNMNNLAGDLTKLSSTWDSLLLSFEDGKGTTGKFLRSMVSGIREVLAMWQRSESGMFQGLESAAITGNEETIKKENELFLKNIDASNKRRNSTKSDLELQEERLSMLYNQIKVDEITLKFDRQKADLSSQNTLAMAYQNGALALRIKYLKEQAALTGVKIGEMKGGVLTKDDNAVIKENTDETEKNTKSKKENNNAEKEGAAFANAFTKSIEDKINRFKELQKIQELNFEIAQEDQKKNGVESAKLERDKNEFKKSQAIDYLRFLENNMNNVTEAEKLGLKLLISQIETDLSEQIKNSLTNAVTKGATAAGENIKKDKSVKDRLRAAIASMFGVGTDESDEIIDATQNAIENAYDALYSAFERRQQMYEEEANAHKSLAESIKGDIDSEIDKQNELARNGAAVDTARIASMRAKLKAEEKAAAESEKQAKIYGERQRTMAITKATINTAQAVTVALQTSSNFWVNLVLAALAAGLGAAEIATISSQKFAEGTEYLDHPNAPQGTDTIPIWADRGERIMSKKDNAKLPKGLKNEEIPNLVNYALFAKGYGGFGTMVVDNSKVDLSKTENYLSEILRETKEKKVYGNNGKLLLSYHGNNRTRYS